MVTKLLIVDDSALMRRLLTQVFEAEGDFEIRVARDGQQAVEENLAFAPDVITLDINMPKMDGLTALAQIMAARPCPVVMVSSLTTEGAEATFEALALGAVDYIAKPGGTVSLSIDEIRSELVAKVRAAAKARVRTGMAGLSQRLRAERQARAAAAKAAAPRRTASTVSSTEPQGLVIIGVSTGGPSTLEEILPELPADFPFPILVAQHMPPAFTGPFAERMDKLCALAVQEVRGPTPIEVGNIYIGRGGADLVVGVRGERLMVLTKPSSPKHLWHPSVEVLGQSVLEHCDPAHVIAVMLTGMGYDGAQAFTELKKRGARVIAESEDSAVVFGMPREVIERDGATVVLPKEKIAAQLLRWAKG